MASQQHRSVLLAGAGAAATVAALYGYWYRAAHRAPEADAAEASSAAAAASSSAAASSDAPAGAPGLPAGVAAPALAAGDAAAIAARLGFVPTNLLRVAARDGGGAPRVLELYPLRRSDPGGRRRPAKGVQPWPTTFWLVDGNLSDRLAALERRGYVGRLERRLASAGGADAAAARAAHAAAGEARWAALTDADRALARARGWEPALRGVGVAGMRLASSVKCLHAYYAFHLGARDAPGVAGVAGAWGPVGGWIHDLLERRADEADLGGGGDGDDAPLDTGRAGGRDRRWRRERERAALDARRRDRCAPCAA